MSQIRLSRTAEIDAVLSYLRELYPLLSEAGVPAVLEQKTTICCKYLYLLASLKASPGLGGVYEDKPQRCGRKPCSWAKHHDKRGQNQGFSSTVCVEEALVFFLTL